jgi:hypothetical protein
LKRPRSTSCLRSAVAIAIVRRAPSAAGPSAVHPAWRCIRRARIDAGKQDEVAPR